MFEWIKKYCEKRKKFKEIFEYESGEINRLEEEDYTPAEIESIFWCRKHGWGDFGDYKIDGKKQNDKCCKISSMKVPYLKRIK